LKTPRLKLKVALVCLILCSFTTMVSASSNLKVTLDDSLFNLLRNDKYQAGNKIVPAIVKQNGATYIVVDLVSKIFQVKNTFDSKTNTLKFTSVKKNEDDIQIRKLQTQVAILNQRINKLRASNITTDGWLEHRSKYYTLLYTDEYKQDLEEVALIFDHAHEVSVKKFKSMLPNVSSILNNESFPIDIYLHPTKTDRVYEGVAYNFGYGGADTMSSDIHILTPSAYQKNGSSSTLEGWEFDDNFQFHMLTHEYIHSPQHILQEQYRNVSGWYPENQPNWLVEGQAEYFAYIDTETYAKKVNFWKPKIIENPQDHIMIYKDSMTVQTPYVGGFLFTAFLYEQYGTTKYETFLMSKKLSMEQAFVETYGSFEKVNSDWQKWLKK
jgi:hypothetical protein